MGHTVYSQLGALLLLACCALAWWRGGAAERWGAGVILATNILADVFLVASYPSYPYFAEFMPDLALALGLLVIAIRFSSLWLGSAIMLQGAGLALYGLRTLSGNARDAHYIHWMNMLSSLMLMSIVAGTIASWRRRSRSKARKSPGDAIAPALAA